MVSLMEEMNMIRKTGTFKAADYSLNLSFAKTINKDSTLSLGIALNNLFSFRYYNSFGSAVDVDLTYHNKKQFTVSLLAKNYGRHGNRILENEPIITLMFNEVK